MVGGCAGGGPVGVAPVVGEGVGFAMPEPAAADPADMRDTGGVHMNHPYQPKR